MEHTTLHLLYSRFWHKFLYDIKVVPTAEPYQKRTSHGLILAEGGEKMSKSKGNVINPDEIVERFGADALRVYEMFMGPFDQAISWSTDNMVGVRRFLEKVWRLQERCGKRSDLEESVGRERAEKGLSSRNEVERGETLRSVESIDALLHKTIKKVGEDIEAMKFNTAVSGLMILVNQFDKSDNISKDNYEKFLILLAPFAPHIAEELWNKIEAGTSILKGKWPEYDASKITEGTTSIAVQVDGKVRATISVSSGDDEENVKEKSLLNENVQKWTEGRVVKKVLYVKGRIVSIVTE